MISEKHLLEKITLLNNEQNGLLSEIYSNTKLIMSKDLYTIILLNSLCKRYINDEEKKELYIKLLSTNK